MDIRILFLKCGSMCWIFSWFTTSWILKSFFHMRKHVAPTPLSWMVHFQILRLLCFHDPKVWCVCVGVADTFWYFIQNWLFIQSNYSFFWKTPYRRPLGVCVGEKGENRFASLEAILVTKLEAMLVTKLEAMLVTKLCRLFLYYPPFPLFICQR